MVKNAKGIFFGGGDQDLIATAYGGTQLYKEFIALLERGFHIVYMDVAEMYGNEASINLWDQFYDYMQQLGMSKKVVLEAMSRGGIYAYNWAIRNPTKVAAIYADAPVLDIKSWPGGMGKGPGSKEDWTIFKNDFNLTEAHCFISNSLCYA